LAMLFPARDRPHDVHIHFRPRRQPGDLGGHLGPMNEFGAVGMHPRPGCTVLRFAIGIDLVSDDEGAGVRLPTPPDRPSLFDPSPQRRKHEAFPFLHDAPPLRVTG
jgi:hypothetical protein